MAKNWGDQGECACAEREARLSGFRSLKQWNPREERANGQRQQNELFTNVFFCSAARNYPLGHAIAQKKEQKERFLALGAKAKTK